MHVMFCVYMLRHVCHAPLMSNLGPTRLFLKKNATVLVVFLISVLGLLTAVNHEWWEDEASPWLSASGSHSLTELIHNLGFNGHPRLYYIIVYWIQSQFGNPLVLSVLNLTFAIVAITFFMRATSFSRVQKLLFAFGFFPLYQYGVVVRGYSLFVCVFFAYCCLKARGSRFLLLRFLLLAVLAQIHLVSAVVATFLLIEEYLEAPLKGNRRPAVTAIGNVIVLVSLLLVAWQLKPEGHPGMALLSSDNHWKSALGFANGFMPNFGVFRLSPIRTGFQIIVGTALWAASWVVAFRHRQLLRYYLPLSFSLFMISVLIYTGERWHHGFYFIFFVVSIWLSTPTPFDDAFSRRFITGLFALHALMGIYALALDVITPYSNGPLVAKFIREHQLEKLPIVGVEASPDDDRVVEYKFVVPPIFPVLLYLPEVGVYDPSAGVPVRRWNHYDDKAYFSLHQDADALSKDLERISGAISGKFLVVVVQNKKILNLVMPGPLKLLSTFPMTYDFGEHLALYSYP